MRLGWPNLSIKEIKKWYLNHSDYLAYSGFPDKEAIAAYMEAPDLQDWIVLCLESLQYVLDGKHKEGLMTFFALVRSHEDPVLVVEEDRCIVKLGTNHIVLSEPGWMIHSER